MTDPLTIFIPLLGHALFAMPSNCTSPGELKADERLMDTSERVFRDSHARSKLNSVLA